MSGHRFQLFHYMLIARLRLIIIMLVDKFYIKQYRKNIQAVNINDYIEKSLHDYLKAAAIKDGKRVLLFPQIRHSQRTKKRIYEVERFV